MGGAARDLLLGRAILDVDLAVSADPMLLAADLERAGFGTAVEISASSPRVARVAGKRELDLAGLEGGSISDDLRRRDFTVNAVAVGLVARAWTDPFGGARDLAAGQLRMISERNLEDDPLRVLRGARLVATHGLSPDGPTTRACRRVAPLLSTAAPERVRSEIVKLLAAPRVTPALSWAGRIEALGPALGLPLPRASARGKIREPIFDAPALRALQAPERVQIRLALLARALRLDAEHAASWLAALRFPRRDAASIAGLMRLAERARTVRGDRERWEWVRDAGSQWRSALLLAALERPPLPAAARSALARRARSARKPPAVTGGDVLAWLGIPAGPAVGRTLRELEVEGMRGAVRTRADARRWITRRAASNPDRRTSGRPSPKL